MNAGNKHDAFEGERRLADIVHALKNPLAGVRGAIQIVCGRLPPSREREILRTAMARLADVDAMLDELASGRNARSGEHAIDVQGRGTELPSLSARKHRDRRNS